MVTFEVGRKPRPSGRGGCHFSILVYYFIFRGGIIWNVVQDKDGYKVLSNEEGDLQVRTEEINGRAIYWKVVFVPENGDEEGYKKYKLFSTKEAEEKIKELDTIDEDKLYKLFKNDYLYAEVDNIGFTLDSFGKNTIVWSRDDESIVISRNGSEVTLRLPDGIHTFNDDIFVRNRYEAIKRAIEYFEKEAEEYFSEEDLDITDVKEEEETTTEKEEKESIDDLTEIKGIGSSTKDSLKGIGVESSLELKEALRDPELREELIEINGVHEAKLRKIEDQLEM